MLIRTVLAAIGVVAFVVFSFLLAGFLSVDNMIDLLNGFALTGLVALPATFLIMSGQVDISVGGTAALVGIVLAATAPGLGVVPALMLALGTGLLIGLGNGLLVTTAEVDSFPATFASMALLRGLAFLLPGGLAIAVDGFSWIGTAEPVAGIAVPTVIFAAVALAAGIVSRSGAGRACRAIGSLSGFERWDGQRERRWVIALFVISGLTATLVGLILAAQLGAGAPTAALGMELTVLAAVLLGGGHLAGGRGSVAGTLLALLLIAVIDNGFSLANVTPYAGPVFAAALLILALVIDPPRRRPDPPPQADSIGR